MAITTTDFTFVFRLDLNPKIFSITDNTDYSLQGAVNSNIVGTIKITGPDGEVAYENNNTSVPDIDRSVGVNNQIQISIPTLDTGEAVRGLYILEYTATDTSDNSFISLVKEFEFCYHSPKVELEMTADCIQPLLVSTDVSNYVVEGITPTITRSHKINYPLITGTSPITATTQRLQTSIFYTKTHTALLVAELNYSFGNGIYILDSVKGAQELNVICDNTLCDLYCCLFNLYKRFKDAQSTNRTLAVDLEKKWLRAESLRSLIKDSYECNKQENVSDLVKDILILGDCEPGCGCAEGDAPTLIGSITSANAVPTTTASSVTGTTYSADNLGSGREVFAQEVSGEFQFRTLIAGNNITLDQDADTITITAVPLSGAAGGNTVVAQGSGVTVASTIVGSVTTYTVSVEASLLSKLNALRNSIVAAGDGVSVSPTTGVDGTVTYTVSSDVEEEDYMEILYALSFGGLRRGDPLVTISILGSKIKGDTFKLPTLAYPIGATAFSLLFTDFTVIPFSPASNYRYIPEIRYLGGYRTKNQQPLPPDVLNINDHSISLDCVYNYEGSVVEDAAPDFKVRFYNTDGSLVSGNTLVGFNQPLRNVRFSIKLIKI